MPEMPWNGGPFVPGKNLFGAPIIIVRPFQSMDSTYPYAIKNQLEAQKAPRCQGIYGMA